MAAHSNRSSSPLCSRPSNPNPRNSENNSATRRSFSGSSNTFSKPSVLTNSRRLDPITPANSPSEFGRRRSVGEEWTGSYQKDGEEKENDEKDRVLKAAKLHSPAKGCKNFMSPTISAASKFTPSPRKKVLVERNDPVRTSISLSDGKAMFFSNMSSNLSEDQLEPKPEMGCHQNSKTETSLDTKVADSEKKKAVPEGNPAPKPSKRVSFSDIPSDSQRASESLPESVVTESDDSLKSESSLKNEVVSPSIVPLDADPSLPPYDPKTNYLSPRPQFLHYKPNPRIEILLNKEKELDLEEFKRLEGSLMAEIMSENFSDSEGSEESQAEDWQREEMEAIAPADMVIGLDEMEADSHVSEPSESFPVSTSVNNAIPEEDVGQKNEKKPRVLFRLMCFSTLLMFLISCVSISVTHSPSLDEFVLKDLSLSDMRNFYHQSRTAAATKVNFDWLARHVNQLSVSSVSIISKLTKELGKGEKQVVLQFMNLSTLQGDTWNEGHFLNNEASKELVEAVEEDELEEDLDAEIDMFEEEEYADIDSDEQFEEEFETPDDVLVTETETYGEEAYAEFDSNEDFEKAYDRQDDILATEETLPDSVKLAELEQVIQSQREVESSVNTKQWDEQNSVDQSAAVLMDQETGPEAATEVAYSKAETEKSHVDNNPGSSACADTMSSLGHKSQSDVDTPSEGVQISSEDNSFLHHAVAVSSLFAALLAVAAFIYQYKRNPSSANIVQADALLPKETGYGFTGTKQVEFSHNWQTEVDEIGSESCPSEMSSSSFQKSASCSKKGGANEAQSSERKFSKRESLASTTSDYSMGSPSYGSFTTYERIPTKHANGEEEIITPVRRSSRIRNHRQVTSP